MDMKNRYTNDRKDDIMAVYEANNIRSLAEYISDTKLGFLPQKVISTKGHRINQEGTSYAIDADSIKCDRIYIPSDCFINADGTLTVISYIPEISYFLNTNELSPSYSNGRHLAFQYKIQSQTVEHTFHNIKLENCKDFEKYMEETIGIIKQTLTKEINEFKDGNGTWTIRSVRCEIEWQVNKVKI